jgi:glyoxylase-like metal-dependent hydrolase (beta-lactamase superfamily II)
MLSRRSFLRLSGAALAATPFARFAAASPSNGTFETLRRNVGTYTQQGGTIGWLASDDALVVVDTQSPDPARACWSGLQERTSRSTIDAVINTHHHGDHTGGNGVFAPHAERIVAHQNVPVFQRRSAEQRGNADAQTYADETFNTEWSADFGDETVQVTYFGPAHTGGDAVIHFQNANVVHVGDLVFNRVYPFIDIPGGASTVGWIDALEQLHDAYTDDTIFIFGHGAPSHGITGDRSDLLAMRDFLSGLLEFVQQGIADGQPLATLADRTVLPGFEEHNLDGWPISLASCLRAVYREQKGTAE